VDGRDFELKDQVWNHTANSCMKTPEPQRFSMPALSTARAIFRLARTTRNLAQYAKNFWTDAATLTATKGKTWPAA